MSEPLKERIAQAFVERLCRILGGHHWVSVGDGYHHGRMCGDCDRREWKT